MAKLITPEDAIQRIQKQLEQARERSKRRADAINSAGWKRLVLLLPPDQKQASELREALRAVHKEFLSRHNLEIPSALNHPPGLPHQVQFISGVTTHYGLGPDGYILFAVRQADGSIGAKWKKKASAFQKWLADTASQPLTTFVMVPKDDLQLTRNDIQRILKSVGLD